MDYLKCLHHPRVTWSWFSLWILNLQFWVREIFVTSSKGLINPQSPIPCSGQQDREANHEDCCSGGIGGAGGIGGDGKADRDMVEGREEAVQNLVIPALFCADNLQQLLACPSGTGVPLFIRVPLGVFSVGSFS